MQKRTLTLICSNLYNNIKKYFRSKVEEKTAKKNGR